MPPSDAEDLQARLLAWFHTHARDLPWRRTRDPYAILVSEVMLQQTQVERVIPKYAAFMAAFPSLEALAAAPTAEVIRLWSGLGYNRRAVNLQRAARAVLEQHGGSFPREVAALRALPGIGPYTAGAVACFAFEQDVAFMDTNIRRVLRRAMAEPASAGPEPTERELLAIGEALVPPGQAWAWNQALMELGALVCTAAAPACYRCPIRARCREHRARDERETRAREGQPGYGSGEGREGAGARVRARVAERSEEPYQGSRRWYRGRIVEALRQLPAGTTIPLADLGPLVKPGFSADDTGWLRALVTGLVRDGLATCDDDTVGLP